MGDCIIDRAPSVRGEKITMMIVRELERLLIRFLFRALWTRHCGRQQTQAHKYSQVRAQTRSIPRFLLRHLPNAQGNPAKTFVSHHKHSVSHADLRSHGDVAREDSAASPDHNCLVCEPARCVLLPSKGDSKLMILIGCYRQARGRGARPAGHWGILCGEHPRTALLGAKERKGGTVIEHARGDCRCKGVGGVVQVNDGHCLPGCVPKQSRLSTWPANYATGVKPCRRFKVLINPVGGKVYVHMLPIYNHLTSYRDAPAPYTTKSSNQYSALLGAPWMRHVRVHHQRLF